MRQSCRADQCRRRKALCQGTGSRNRRRKGRYSSRPPHPLTSSGSCSRPIHGTPEPDKVSKTESHGCIRLTNWDALALAELVRKGMAGRVSRLEVRFFTIDRDLIGTLRRDCLDHVVIFGARHLRRVLTAYSAYYNQTRTHLSLEKDAPLGRAIQRHGAIVTVPILSGLHHCYARI